MADTSNSTGSLQDVSRALPRLTWALPAVLSCLLAGGMFIWSEVLEREQRSQARELLISNTKSLRAQLEARRELETKKLQLLAAALPVGASFSPQQEAEGRHALNEGVRNAGLWRQLTWMNAAGVRVAQVHRERADTSMGSEIENEPRVRHFVVLNDSSSGCQVRLSASYTPMSLLRDEAAQWLTQRYRAEIFTGDVGEPLASTITPADVSLGLSSVVKLDEQAKSSCPDTTLNGLELKVTELLPLEPWYGRRPVLPTIAAFVLLIGGATWLLHMQISRTASAEEQWRTESAWRAAMEDSALVGLRARDLQGRLLHANRTFCELVGYDVEELQGCEPAMPYWAPDRVEEAKALRARHLQGKAERGGEEMRWQRRDGRRLDVVLFESPLVDAHGTQIGWMGSVVDVTERNVSEERARRQTATLANHARLHAVGEMASSLAHELNQPLGAITNYGAGLRALLQKREPCDPDLARVAGEIERHARQAGAIVHRVRKHVATGEVTREPCDLNLSVKTVAELLKHELERTSVRLELELDQELPVATVDRVGIEQVITNLLRNAIDALAGRVGTRRILVRTCATTNAQESAVSVRIDDNGPGLAGASLATLVEPFHTSKASGMGLGLAICRSILDSHHGSLTAEESTDGGACFTFWIPAVTSAKESA